MFGNSLINFYKEGNLYILQKITVLRCRSNFVLQINQSLTVAGFLGKNRLKTLTLSLKQRKDCKSSLVIAVRHLYISDKFKIHCHFLLFTPGRLWYTLYTCRMKVDHTDKHCTLPSLCIARFPLHFLSTLSKH